MVNFPFIFIAIFFAIGSGETLWISASILTVGIVFALLRLYKQHRGKTGDNQFVNYLRNTPLCQASLAECYVKVYGKVITANSQLVPYVNKSRYYSGFHSKVLGVWQAKRKKPQKGFEQAKKVLHQTTSQEKIAVQTQDATVYFEPAVFLTSAVALLSQEKQTISETAVLSILNQTPPSRHYNSYEVVTQSIKQGDDLTLFGCLVQRDGELYLIDRHLPNYPSIIAQGKPEVVYQHYQTLVNQYYQVSVFSIIGFIVQVLFLLWIAGRMLMH